MNYGVLVPVSCEETFGIELRGDNAITCVEGIEYKYKVKPKCNQVGMLVADLVHYLRSKFHW